MSLSYRFVVGVDWATQAHQICTLDPQRQVIDERRVEHGGLAIMHRAGWLAKLAGGDTK